LHFQQLINFGFIFPVIFSAGKAPNKVLKVSLALTKNDSLSFESQT